MLAVVLVEIYEFRGFARASHCGIDDSIGLSDECYNRPVVIRIGLAIEEDDAFDGFDCSDDLINYFNASPFAEIRDALDNASHDQNPNRFVMGLQRIELQGESRGIEDRG